MRASSRSAVLATLVAGALAAALGWPNGAARAVTPVPVSPGGVAPGPHTMPDTPAGGDDRKAQINDLDQQIKALREQYHSQLDPLQAQIKDLREKFDPQIKTLEDQRRDLVESGKAPAVQDLDKQEASELAGLSDQEKAEIDRVHQHYADARKDVQAKYQKERDALRTNGH